MRDAFYENISLIVLHVSFQQDSADHSDQLSHIHEKSFGTRLVNMAAIN